MRESFMKLFHEDLIVSLSKVSMVVATKLVIAIDHVANCAHQLLYSVHGAHVVSITVQDSDWGVFDVLDWDVGRCAVMSA